MRVAHLPLLACPACRGTLQIHRGRPAGDRLTDGALGCECGRIWKVHDRAVDFLYPDKLLPSDDEFRAKYDQGADRYDKGLDWLFASFYENQTEVRKSMVGLLELEPGHRVLDIGCGTGKDSLEMARRMSGKGEIFLLDLSGEMLRRATRRLEPVAPAVESLLANGAYLPFADRTFDGVFHFGGINEFGEIRRALAEMARVTRRGGKVVVGDEGVAPWLRRRTWGRILAKANPLYRHRPPLESLPVGARDVRLRWILGNAFYLIDFRVADGPPAVDLDLPIPGKGDSLRSRYYGPEG